MTTIQAAEQQLNVANQIRKNILGRIGIKPTDKELTIHTNFILYQFDFESISEIENWLQKILTKNNELKYFDETSLQQLISKTWWHYFNRNTTKGFLAYNIYI